MADAGYGSEENYAHLEREGADAHVKHSELFRIERNLGFTRFTLRGLEKVTLGWRLVAAGHNIRKLFLAECEKGKRAAGAMAQAGPSLLFRSKPHRLSALDARKGGCIEIDFDTAPS